MRQSRFAMPPCFLSKDQIGLDWIKVGDAAFAIDPLSSQGVQMAMMSAFQGSIAVHTLLTQPEQANAAIDFYRNKLQETVARSQTTAAQVYAFSISIRRISYFTINPMTPTYNK